MIGLSRPPIPITNLYAHRVVDNDTSRIVELSTIGGNIGEVQHYGHNSRDVTITGRIVIGYTSFNTGGSLSAVALATQTITSSTLITAIKYIKETKSPVILLMNHGFMFGIIKEFTITDDKDHQNAFDYTLRIIEKEIAGRKPSALQQMFLNALYNYALPQVDGLTSLDTFGITGDMLIPNFLEP